LQCLLSVSHAGRQVKQGLKVFRRRLPDFSLIHVQ
jgi:hypothetical protein